MSQEEIKGHGYFDDPGFESYKIAAREYSIEDLYSARASVDELAYSERAMFLDELIAKHAWEEYYRLNPGEADVPHAHEASGPVDNQGEATGQTGSSKRVILLSDDGTTEDEVQEVRQSGSPKWLSRTTYILFGASLVWFTFLGLAAFGYGAYMDMLSQNKDLIRQMKIQSQMSQGGMFGGGGEAESTDFEKSFQDQANMGRSAGVLLFEVLGLFQAIALLLGMLGLVMWRKRKTKSEQEEKAGFALPVFFYSSAIAVSMLVALIIFSYGILVPEEEETEKPAAQDFMRMRR